MPAPSQPAANCAAGSIPAPGGAGCVKLPSPTTPQADFTMEYEPMTPSPAPKKRTAAPTTTHAHADFTMEFEPMTPSPAPSTTTATNTATTSVLGTIRKLRTQEEVEAEEREAMRRTPAAQVVGSTQWRNRVAKEQHQRQQARDATARTGADADAAAPSSLSSSGSTSSNASRPRGGVTGSSKLDKARGRADEAAIAAGLKSGPMPASSRPVGQAGKGKGQVQAKGAKGGRSAMPAASRPVRSEEVPKSLLDKFGRPKGNGRSSSRRA